MSGGIAYVYDPQNRFADDVNYEMVEIEELDSSDVDWLHDVVEQHRDLTGSEVARRLVDAWSAEVSNFRKVMPRDYKRVLQVLKDASARGLTDDETAEIVMEVARG
jgi:glutamate synthase domain-containing protein 3